MTEEYLTDDEQLAEVKRIAMEYAPWIIPALVLGVGFVIGYRYYQGHENQRAFAAAGQFADMNSAVQRGDATKARQIADGLIKNFPSSPYADQAQLTMARLLIDEGQDASAIGPLTQVMDHSNDSELRHIAQLRIARVLIDQGKPDDAIKMLSADPGAFAAAYHEVLGDAYFAKNDLPKAASEYETALGAGVVGGRDSAMLELKIADLGLPPTAMPAVPAAAAPTVESSNKVKP